MVEISAQMVKELRDRSGAAMMDCKKALVEASGDFEKAFEWLRQKGVAVASKKAARTASEGLVVGQVSPDGKTGVLLEVNCETDFVARNEEFVALTKELADALMASQAKGTEEFLKCQHKGGSIADLITERIAKTGENIVVRRTAVVKLEKEGIVGLYVHALGGKMGALVRIEADKAPSDKDRLAQVAKDVAMHVVSAKPQFVNRSDIPAEVIENERRIESGKQDLQDKKPEMREKIVQGRVDKIIAERCLCDQQFVKDPTQTVAKYLAQVGKEVGATLEVKQFALFILGETQSDADGKSEE
ncbi:MAG TPA: translation elongation factor Ts [Candidatus Obscuribacterales bacterium]